MVVSNDVQEFDSPLGREDVSVRGLLTIAPVVVPGCLEFCTDGVQKDDLAGVQISPLGELGAKVD